MPGLPDRKFRVMIVDDYLNANANCRGFPQFEPTYDCPYPGWCLEIMNQFVKAANLSVEWMVRKNRSVAADWGMPIDNNGTFNGVLGEIRAGLYDTACLLYQKSTIRTEYFTYSMPVTEVTQIFVVKELPRTLYTSMFIFLHPFSSTVWLLFLLVFIIQITISIIVGNVEIRLRLRDIEHSGEFAWRVVDEFFNGGFNAFTLYAGTILRLIFSVFGIGFLPELYKGILLTALVTPPNTSPIKNALDVIKLVASKKYHLACNRNTWFYEELHDSTDPFFVQLRKATAANPVVFPEERRGGLQKLMEKGNFIYQTQEDTIDFQKARESCRTIIISEGLPYRSAHFMWNADNPFREKIDRQILKNYAMTESVQRRYFQNKNIEAMRPSCPPDQYTQREDEALNVFSVFGQFAVMCAGLVIALIALCMEIAVHFTIAKIWTQLDKK